MKNLLALILITVFTLIAFPSFAQKKAISVQTIKIIDAPANEVYDILRSFERFPEWSPFLVTDPQQKNKVTGTNGQEGSVFHWEGVAEKSLGTQRLTELKDNYLLMNCNVIKPQKSTGVFEYILKEENGQTVVTQNFSIPCTGFQKFMMGIFGVKKQVTKINELGMERLMELAVKESNSNI